MENTKFTFDQDTLYNSSRDGLSEAFANSSIETIEDVEELTDSILSQCGGEPPSWDDDSRHESRLGYSRTPEEIYENLVENSLSRSELISIFTGWAELKE